MGFPREEIQEAFDRYCAAAESAGRTGDWQPWVECFTEDVHYIEHVYGEFHGRQAVLEWITATMTKWPFTEMQEFPWDWYTIDAEQGWVVGQVENRFVDPGDGQVYEGANWTRLVYAGDGLFASEEDVYNPAHFAPVVEGWLAAHRAHHPAGRVSEASPGDGASASEPGADGARASERGRSPQDAPLSEASPGDGASASEPGGAAPRMHG